MSLEEQSSRFIVETYINTFFMGRIMNKEIEEALREVLSLRLEEETVLFNVRSLAALYNSMTRYGLSIKAKRSKVTGNVSLIKIGGPVISRDKQPQRLYFLLEQYDEFFKNDRDAREAQ